MAATSLWFDQALLSSGWASGVRMVVSDGRIATVEAGAPREAADERHAIALPGMPNLHSHAFQRGMAGLAERRGEAGDDSFWTWRETMYRFVDRIGPAELQAIATLAFVEMLECGFTRIGEFHYLHHAPDGRAYDDPAETARAIAAAADAAGIGLTLLPVFYAHGGFGGQAPGVPQRRFVTSVDGFARLVEASGEAASGLADANVGVAPHSLRAVTPDELAAILALPGPVHIHVAEQEREVADCLAWSGARPVEWLLDNAPVDRRWCLVHATHMTAAEAARAAGSGAVVGLCPITEANLGDGVFDAPAYRGAGGSFGIGSDSNVLISLAEELRTLEYSQRLTLRRRNVMADAPATGASLFSAALAGGGQALGVEAGLRPGAPADLFTLDAEHPNLVGRRGDAALDSFVFAGVGVDCVWRAGRRAVSGGQHHARDAARSAYREALGRLLA